MSSLRISLLVVAVLAAPFTAVFGDDQTIGRSPTAAEIERFDIDVRPDGKGLPAGQGSVMDGEILYDELCASCHGTFGEGSGRFPALAGGQGTLDADRPVKTVGSFWPYAAPLFDYTYRTMPFGNSQSLTAEQTYAILAYVFYLNDLVSDESILDKKSLSAMVMPNAKGFVKAPEIADTPQTRCMQKCKTEIGVHSRAGALDVTPKENKE